MMDAKTIYCICLLLCMSLACKKDVPETKEPPRADFTFTMANAGVLPTTVNFTSTATHATAYFWDFGDGNTSTALNPVNVYKEARTYTVKLVVNGAAGKDSMTKTVEIIQSRPKAAFSYSLIDSGAYPTHVRFANTTTGGATFKWLFDNGDSSLVENPTDSFYTAKTYTVKLIATNAAGSDTVTKPLPIHFTAPKASFSYTILDPGNYPVHIRFTNTSTTAASYKWVFDNGDISTEQNPTDSFFTAKTFNVKLVASSAVGKDSITIPVTITINKPVANFTVALGNASRVPCNASFTNTSVNAATYKWYFSDGSTSTDKHPMVLYNQPRNYMVKLVATNPAGSDSITKQVTVTPILNSVVVYLITPRDKKMNQAYYDILKNEVLSLQAWYKAQMGNNKTFVTNPMILDTLTGLHDSVWYNSYNGTYSGNDPRYYGYYNAFYEMQQLLGSSFNTSSYAYFIYVAAPGGGAGSKGFCAMGDQDLKGLLGINPEWWDPNRWVGGGGHELGHAFGLPHPANENPRAIMWTGYASYPNCILQQEDKDILNASPFFR